MSSQSNQEKPIQWLCADWDAFHFFLFIMTAWFKAKNAIFPIELSPLSTAWTYLVVLGQTFFMGNFSVFPTFGKLQTIMLLLTLSEPCTSPSSSPSSPLLFWKVYSCAKPVLILRPHILHSLVRCLWTGRASTLRFWSKYVSATHWIGVLISFFKLFVCRTCPKLFPIICSIWAMQIKRHGCKMALGNWFHSPIPWNDRDYISKCRQQEDFPSKQRTPSNLPGNFNI